MSQPIYYLAYGSNLDRKQMAQRAPSAKPVGKLILTDAKLVFRGVADVAYVPGARVPVGIWRIKPHDEAALDQYEGVRGGLYRKAYIAFGKGKRGLIYLMNSEGIMPPSQHYADGIRRGYKHFGLDASYLNIAIAESWNEKAPTELETRRRERQRTSTNHQRLAKFVEVEA